MCAILQASYSSCLCFSLLMVSCADFLKPSLSLLPASGCPQEQAPHLPPLAANTGILQSDAGASPVDSDDAKSVASASVGNKVLRRRPSVFNSPPPTEWKRLEMEVKGSRSGSSSSSTLSRSGEGEACEEDEDSTPTTGSDDGVA